MNQTLTALDFVICQESVQLVWVPQEISRCNMSLIHSAHKLQSADSKSIPTKDDDLLKILCANSSKGKYGDIKQRTLALSLKHLVSSGFNHWILLNKNRE